jgi:hypothetical protein
LFRRQLSGKFRWDPEADGTYFLDADPDLFEHLLRFMRRPEVFPLFYTKSNGFDYDLYNRLEAEAMYFQVDALYKWINAKSYLMAVVTNTYSAQVQTINNASLNCYPASVQNSEHHHMIPRTKKIYLCPRRIFVHRGDRNRCGLACRKAQGDQEDEYEEENYIEQITVKTEVEFNQAVCRLEEGDIE